MYHRTMLLACVLAVASPAIGGLAHPAPRNAERAPQGMVRIPPGHYKPFYITKGIDSVRIPAFYMDARPVTNREYLEFVKQNLTWSRSRVPVVLADKGYLKQWKSDFEIGDPQIENSPVVNVSWFAARAYAKWAGKRLPTIAEWEYASLAPLVWPQHAQGKAKNAIILSWYDRPNASALQPAGSGNRNAYGVTDLFGQVWEWVGDFSSVIIPTDPRGGLDLKSFCGSGAFGTIDPTDYATFMRFAMRNSLKAPYTVQNLGFRCVQDVTESAKGKR